MSLTISFFRPKKFNRNRVSCKARLTTLIPEGNRGRCPQSSAILGGGNFFLCRLQKKFNRLHLTAKAAVIDETNKKEEMDEGNREV